MNTRPIAAIICLLIASPSPARAQTDARAMVERAVQLMGGEQTLRSLRTLRYDATAVLFNLGQNPGLHEPMPFNTRTSVIRHDYAGTRIAVLSEIPGGPNGLPFRQRFVQSPAAGMADNNGNFQPLPAVVPVAIRTFPGYLLLAALDPAARLERAGAGVRLYGALDTLTMFFDATGRLAHTETVTDDPMLGDRVTRTTYRNWTPLGRDGLTLPTRVDVSANGTVIQINNLRGFAPNEALPDSVFLIPDSMVTRSRALGAGGAGPVVVRVDSVAPGVYHLTGGSHHSLAVVQRGSTVVFEAPQSTARMRAVLDTLASRFPQAPVRTVVNSHEHWDHASGVRAALAARLTVLAHTTSLPQLRETARARRTIAPDGVERMRHDLRAVGDSLVIGTGAEMLVIYRLPTTHDDGLLVGYHPASRILFVTDVIPSQTALANREVVDFVAARGLAVERVVPSHGAIVPWSRVQQLAQP